MAKSKRRSVRGKMVKYYRWFRFYMRRVRQTERQIGGVLEAC